MRPIEKLEIEALGLDAVIHTSDELLWITETGLPKKSLELALRHIFEDRTERSRFKKKIIPEATYKRRKDKLSSEESQKLERITRIIATSNYVWDDPKQSQKFLRVENKALGGKKPIDLTLTELGARKVENLLCRIFHGIPE